MATTSAQEPELLEREEVLEQLGAALARAARGRGGLVFAAGEAGVGKTVAVRRFCSDNRDGARVLVGVCDSLFTPRPLGPFLDVARTIGGEFRELTDTGAAPHRIAAALLSELGKPSRPTVLFIEDVHWADEATLDVLRLLGRRIESVPALVIATYRDDELGRSHPLRIVLGELATSLSVEPLTIARLSPAAVAALAEPAGLDAAELYRRTNGNAFFVTEAIASGDEGIPRTVRDAVLARAARLTAPARALLDVVAIIPSKAEFLLIEALAVSQVDRLDECLESGMLIAEPDAVSFRHELARRAIEEALAPHTRLALHKKALAALATKPDGTPDPARLAHHAEAAGDALAVQRYAPAAAARAVSLGAHREAAAQYARALRFANGLSAATRARLLESYSYECYLTADLEEAVAARQQALAAYHVLGDPLREGDQLRALSRLLMLRLSGGEAEAEEAGRMAVELLERLPPSRELAAAYSNVAQLRMITDDREEAIAWGMKAIALAEELGEMEVLIHALNNVGHCDWSDAGIEMLERSLRLALDAGFDEHAARAYSNLARHLSWARSYEQAERCLEEGIIYTDERDLDAFRLYLIAERAQVAIDQGLWTQAGEDADLVLRHPRQVPLNRFLALIARARLRTRRGDPGGPASLAEARRLAAGAGGLGRLGMVAAVSAEAAWLKGQPGAIDALTAEALELALRKGDGREVGELSYWRHQAGLRDELPPFAVAEPYATHLAGDWRRAAELWTTIGCPYEAALALAEGDDEDALRRALAEFQRLGARPASTMAMRRLRERGVRGLPRGPRATTRVNPAGLTTRELEVLALLAGGLRTAEIAERLFLSARTVDHHIAAILRKLHVRTRGQACAEAARLGLLESS